MREELEKAINEQLDKIEPMSEKEIGSQIASMIEKQNKTVEEKRLEELQKRQENDVKEETNKEENE